MKLKHKALLPGSSPPCVRVCVLEVPMAECGEDGSLPPLNLGDAAVPSDEVAGKTHCEVSVSNGNCGISENMVGSGSFVAPGNQDGVENADAAVGLDAKSELPRRSSIIKVNIKVGACSFWRASQHIYTDPRAFEVATQPPCSSLISLCF